MKLIVLIAVLSFSLAAISQSLGPSEDRCSAAHKLAMKGVVSEELAILADCYYEGIVVERDVREARYYYLQAAINGSRYAEIQLSEMLLFEGEDKLDRATGFYIAQKLAQSEVSEYRGDARYLIGLYLLRKGQSSASENYFDLAIEDSRYDAAYAKLYLEYSKAVNKSSFNYVMEGYLKKAQEIQKALFGEMRISFECWVDYQDYRRAAFPINEGIKDKLKEIIGPCDKQLELKGSN